MKSSRQRWRRIVFVSASVVTVATFLVAGFVGYTLWRHEVFVAPTYEVTPPALPKMESGPRVLIFSKTNSFRHVDAIPAAQDMLREFAAELDWSTFFTENAAVHTPEILGKFDLIIWCHVSGDVLTETQRDNFKGHLESGARVLAIHATGGDPLYEWQWHPKEFIRAQFVGHPMVPQFQDAIIDIEDADHPAMEHLPDRWEFHDEWYSFRSSPRDRVNVLATLDESTYSPTLAGPFGDLGMRDHPIIWWHDVGKGRVFYSALGHKSEAYADENYRELLKQACLWLLDQEVD